VDVLLIASVKHAEEQTAGLSVVILIFGLTLAIERGDAVEEELGDVGEGNGVAAGDASNANPGRSRAKGVIRESTSKAYTEFTEARRAQRRRQNCLLPS